MGNGELIPFALSYAAAGLSVIPVGPDKRSHIKWEDLQARILSEQEIREHWKNGASLAIGCGPISGNLEVMDFDCPEKDRIAPAWEDFRALLKEHGQTALWNKLVKIETPSGGKHLLYRLTHAPQGNTKLAADEQNRVTIETRGRGGYVVTAPSPGYVLKYGEIENIPVLTEDEHEFLLCAARFLDIGDQRKIQAPRGSSSITRPGDAYNLSGDDCATQLLNAGWKPCRGKSGGLGGNLFTRPGKDHGASASVTTDGRLCYVYSSNAYPLEAGKCYDRFALYTWLNFKGEFGMAARDLASKGYGASSIQQQTNTERIVVTKDFNPGGTEWFDESGDLVFRPLSEFEAKAPDFFWEGYLLNDNINLAEGKGSVGKSSFFLALAAGGSKGFLPFRAQNEPFTSIIFTKQDGPGAYRMKISQLMGGEDYDVDRICVFPATLTLDSSGLTKLAKFIERNEAKYVVFDPIKGMMPPYVKAEYDNPNIERFLNDLRACCVSAGAAPQLVKHFARFTNGRELTDLGAGGEEWRNSARTQLVFLPHPDQENFPFTTGVFPARGFILGKPGRPFGYKVVASGAIGWISPGAFDITPYAEAYPSVAQYYGIETENHTPKRGGGRKPTSSKPCLDFLIDFLQQNGPAFVSKLRDECQSNGWDAKVMYRAKDMSGGRIQESAYHPKTWKLVDEE